MEPNAGQELEVPAQEADQGTSAPWWAWLVIVAAFGGLVFLAYRAYPAHHPQNKNPSFIDDIFANNLVLFAARLVLFSTAVVLTVMAVYVIYSQVIGMTRGHVLAKFGPFEMQAVEDLSADVEMWQNLWSEENQENAQLRAQLEETDETITRLYDEYQDVVARLAAYEEQGSQPPPPAPPSP